MPRVNDKLARVPALDEAWLGAVDDHAMAAAWSPNGQWLATAPTSGPVVVFGGGDGAVHQSLPGHGFGTTTLAWSADGARLATAGQDGLARVWDPATGAERFRVEGGSAWVESLGYCPTAPLLATGAGKMLRLWDDVGRLVREYPRHPSTIADIAWKPRAAVLASAAYGQLALWAPDRAEPLQAFAWKGSMLALDWSPDGRYIATGDQDSTVHFWIIKTGRDLMMWGYPMKVRELSWDASSRYLATGGGPDVVVWDCAGKGPEGTEPLTLTGTPDRPITVLAFRPGGPVLATGDVGGRVRIYRIGRSAERVGHAQLGAEVCQLAWNPTGRRIAATTATGTVAVFETPWF